MAETVLNNNNKENQYFVGVRFNESGKSYFLSQRCVIDVLKGRNYLVLRKTGSSITGSVFNEVTKKINDFFPNFNIRKQIWNR